MSIPRTPGSTTSTRENAAPCASRTSRTSARAAGGLEDREPRQLGDPRGRAGGVQHGQLRIQLPGGRRSCGHARGGIIAGPARPEEGRRHTWARASTMRRRSTRTRRHDGRRREDQDHRGGHPGEVPGQDLQPERHRSTAPGGGGSSIRSAWMIAAAPKPSTQPSGPAEQARARRPPTRSCARSARRSCRSRSSAPISRDALHHRHQQRVGRGERHQHQHDRAQEAEDRRVEAADLAVEGRPRLPVRDGHARHVAREPARDLLRRPPPCATCRPASRRSS